MYVLIFLLTFIAVLIAIILVSFYYLSRENENFLERTEQSANLNSQLFISPDLYELAELEMTPEFRASKEKAVQADDRISFANFLRDNDLRDYVFSCAQFLESMVSGSKLKDCFIISCKEDGNYYVIGNWDAYYKMGDRLAYTIDRNSLAAREPFTTQYIAAIPVNADEENSSLKNTALLVRQISLAPIGEMEDEFHTNYWLVCESDIMELIAGSARFILLMIVFLFLITTGCSIAGALFMRRTLTVPIIRMREDAMKFTAENSVEASAKPIDSGISSNDELEDLSRSILELENSVVKTQEQLKLASEEKGKMKAELSIATAIQQGVLPVNFPDTGILNLFALMIPAREVGGDFYDFFYIDENHLCLVIGDVSDKGIPASLFMMTSKTLIKTEALAGRTPAEIFDRVNDRLCDHNPAEMFVTVWLGILDLSTGVMTCSNAGHEYPMLQVGGNPFEMLKDKHGPALAVFPGVKYENYEITLKGGDRLLVYSDGAPDAHDVNRKDFGLDRLLETVRKASAEETSRSLVEQVNNTLTDFSRETSQFDDITLLSISIEHLRNGDKTGNDGSAPRSETEEPASITERKEEQV